MLACLKAAFTSAGEAQSATGPGSTRCEPCWTAGTSKAYGSTAPRSTPHAGEERPSIGCNTPASYSISSTVEGEIVEGYWFDRTQEHAARRRGKTFDRLAFAEGETVSLSPLPCWKNLSPELQHRRVMDLVALIEAEASERRAQTGSEPLGVSAVLGQHPHDRPRRLKRSPAPLFHAFRKSVHRELYQAYAWFTSAYREASERLRAGDLSALFPTGSFPPALPFVAG